MKRRILLLSLLLPASLFAQLTTTISGTNITCNGYDDGTANIAGGIAGASQPIMISEVNTNTPDFIELTNVSGQTVNTSGWFVITSASYTAINSANTLSWSLPSSVASGWVDYREDATGTNYWGNNLFYSSGSNGWVLLSDDQGNIVDFVAWGWSESEIVNNFNVSFGSFTFNITDEWSGAGVNATCSSSLIRGGNEDNDNASDWSCGTTSKGSVNAGLSLPFLGGVGISYLWSTGDTVTDLSDLGPGWYFVTTTTALGDTAIDSIEITEPPVPNFSLPNDTVLCEGSAMILAAEAGWESYTWNTGTIGQSVLVSDPGVYTCTITDTNGCFASDSITITGGLTPVVDLGGDTSLCDTFLLLDAGNAGSQYSWSNGATSQTTSISSGGTYSVTVSSIDGCEASDDIFVTMYPPASVDLGEDFTLCYNYNQTKLLTAGASFTFYQWSTGATSTSLLVGSGITQPGSELISILVTDDNGCTATDTVKVTYDICSGIADLNAAPGVNIFPNPASDQLSIESPLADIIKVEIFDISGKLVAGTPNASSKRLVNVNTASLSSGSYFVKVHTSEGVANQKLIVR